MKRKLSKKLLCFMLSGILLVPNVGVLPVYAAEETEVTQGQDGSPERPAEQNLSETGQKAETEEVLETEKVPGTEKVSETEEALTTEEATETEKTSETEETARTDNAETTEEAAGEQESATEEESFFGEEATEEETRSEEEATEEETAEEETTEEETLSEEEITEEAESLNPDAEETTDVPAPKEVYDKMIAMQKDYPEGMYWTDASSGNYRWNGGRGENNEIANVGSGCVYFAYRLSDEAFGSLPARMLRPGNFTFGDIMVGDILRVENNRHSVIVLQVNDDTIVIAEGNYNKSIHWGRIMTKAEAEAADHVLTRYPKGYLPPDDPEADDIVAQGDFDSEGFEDYKGGLTWKLTKSGTLTISGNGAMPDFNFGGTSASPVSNRPWNDHIGKVQKIVIESGVTGIGSNAFRGSVAYSVSIPASVKSIGNDAFRECKNITFAAPEGVVTIGERAFRGCENLKGITIPGSIKTVGAGAFFNCTELRGAKFVSGGNAVTVGEDAFAGCHNLSDVTLPIGLKVISKQMFQNCLALSELSIPAGVTEIGEGAFKSCSRLTTLYIPKSVTDINMQVFTNCGLADIYYEGSEAEWNAIGKWGDSKTILSTLQSNGKVHYAMPAPAEAYTITFDTQGHGTALAPAEAVPGATIAKPDDPSADGYKFEGWYREADCINAWNFATDTVQSDMTLYAKWSEDKQNPDDNPSVRYTVTFDVQGHGAAPTAVKAEAGKTIAEPNVPSADGYKFEGWYREAVCINAWNFATDTVESDMTLYAKWSEDQQNPGETPGVQYTVTFNVQGHGIAGLAPAPVKVEAGKMVAEPEVAPYVDACHYIGGWYREAGCINAWNFAVDTVTSDTTLYAKWVLKDNDTSHLKPDQRKSLGSVEAIITTNIKSKVYDGKPYQPVIKVTAKDGDRTVTLTEGIDYRVSYEKNINAGTGKVIVRGNGAYKDEIAKEFVITKKKIKKLSIITGGAAAGIDDKAESAWPVYVYDNAEQLKEGKDYVLSEPVFNKKGTTATITVTAAEHSNYTGSSKAVVTVYQAEPDKIINPGDVELSADEADYTGKAIKSIEPTVTVNDVILTKNRHYTVQYKNNTKAGTAYIIITGKGGYKGKVIETFTIKPSEAELTIKKAIPAKTYNGKPQKPSVTVMAGTKKLKANTDYTVTYTGNVLAGTASVCIMGIGNYAGARTQTTFTIIPRKISAASIKTSVKTGMILTYNKKQLTEGIDYTLTYGEEKNGKTEVTITGINDFTGEKTKFVKTDILAVQ